MSISQGKRDITNTLRHFRTANVAHIFLSTAAVSPFYHLITKGAALAHAETA
jgi:hypothetical protein